MTIRDRLPFNAEPPGPVLAGAEITPLDAFYCRNHGPFPEIAPEQWRLTVDGMIGKPLTLTYGELTNPLPRHEPVGMAAVVYHGGGPTGTDKSDRPGLG